LDIYAVNNYMLLDNYQGRLIISQPRCRSEIFSQGVVLIIRHSSNGAWGVMLNKPISSEEVSIADILEHVGMENPHGVHAPLHVGGPVERGRICVIHSDEWRSSTTQQICTGISVTTDISVLSAIVALEGPAQYRIFSGLSVWGAGQLDGEMRGKEPWTPLHQWLSIPADVDTIFQFDTDDQWQHSLALAVDQEVKELF
jgi:putative transcriptional regulator